MKKNCYIFCHGFGLDHSFWSLLKNDFEHEETFYCDLGYFGEMHLPKKIFPDAFDYIGIGHSLGLIKLLSLPIPWKFLLGLNGFTNFLGQSARLKLKRQREWEYLSLQLKRSPQAALEGFYDRAGLTYSPDWAHMNHERLNADLQWMITPVHPIWPVLFLGSRDDVIVPPDLLEENVRNAPNCRIQYIDGVQHNLGYLLPQVVRSYCDMQSAYVVDSGLF